MTLGCGITLMAAMQLNLGVSGWQQYAPNVGFKPLVQSVFSYICGKFTKSKIIINNCFVAALSTVLSLFRRF